MYRTWWAVLGPRIALAAVVVTISIPLWVNEAAAAWSCADVRRLSFSEREQAARELHLTEAQKARIRRACKLDRQ